MNDKLRHGTRQSYADMKQRCCNPKNHNYNNYGGRGISVCQRWMESFQYFLADMGERPEGLTLERTDSNGNYEPLNCSWADRQTQRENQRRCSHITWDGITLTPWGWGKRLGLHGSAIQKRLDRGWPVESILSPIRSKGGGSKPSPSPAARQSAVQEVKE